MSFTLLVKEKAIELRKDGLSLKEISEELKIAKSTASLWLSDIPLSLQAQQRLAQKKILGQYKTVLLKKQQREERRTQALETARAILNSITLSNEIKKLCCAFIWWCEGNKTTSMVRFTSSDTSLVKNFLFLLRSAFELNEAKFRALVHIHGYHNDLEQKKFWSRITRIPLNQFHKSFQKPNTGVRIHENYPGCISISYYDAQIAKELEAIYNAFTEHRGVG